MGATKWLVGVLYFVPSIRVYVPTIPLRREMRTRVINLVYTQTLPKTDLDRLPTIRPGDRLKPLQGTVFPHSHKGMLSAPKIRSPTSGCCYFVN
jgi:hypothetical protein